MTKILIRSRLAQDLARGKAPRALDLSANARGRVSSRRRDPTQTTMLTRQWEREFEKRWDRVTKAMIREIVKKDGLGLKTNLGGRFEFSTDPQRVLAFEAWASNEIDKHLLNGSKKLSRDEAADRFWGNSWANAAYRRGLINGSGQVRRGGATVSEGYIKNAITRTRHAEAMRQIHSRTYEELAGIGKEAARQMGVAMAEALASGRGVAEIAAAIRDRVDKIGKARSRLIARTEVISAYNEAEIGVYEDAGLKGIRLIPEWLTAEDMRVCPQCEEMSQRSWTIETARGVLPLHPRCRCSWAPIIQDGKGISLT